MKIKPFHFTYYRQIQGSFLIFVITPMLIVMMISFIVIQDHAKEKIKLSNESVVALMGKDISKMLDEVMVMSDYFVQNEDVFEQLSKFKEVSKLTSYSEYQTFLEIRSFFGKVTLKAMNPDLFVYLVNNEGFIIQPSMREDLPPTSILLDWEAAKERVDSNKAIQLQRLGVIKQGTERKYYLARVITDADTKVTIATLYISISAQYFENIFDQVKSGSIAIYDENNQFIAGNEQIQYDSNGRKLSSLRTEYTFDQNNWKMIYETPPGVVTGQMMQMLIISLLFIVPCFLLFIWIAIVLARKIHRPILQLQNGIKQFSNGNLNIQFKVDGPQELIHFGNTLNTMVDQINELIVNIEQEQEQKRKLELHALSAQIRPHFLLNTLNSIRCNLVLHEDEYHSQKLASLMSLLRAYMTFDDKASLAQEAKLLGNYVDIMNMRNDMQLSMSIELSEEAAEVLIPKLILQPVVENAFVHGFTEDHMKPEIKLKAWIEHQRCKITIVDNGEGINELRLQQLQQMLQSSDLIDIQNYDRVGLLNILRRLQMIYGSTANIQLFNHELGGTSVCIDIPYRE